MIVLFITIVGNFSCMFIGYLLGYQVGLSENIQQASKDIKPLLEQKECEELRKQKWSNCL